MSGSYSKYFSLRGVLGRKSAAAIVVGCGALATLWASTAFTQPVPRQPAAPVIAPAAPVATPTVPARILIPPHIGPFKRHGSDVVRGYIVASVGRSGDAERSALYSRTLAAKDIYLPGVTVYLDDPQTGKTSEPIKTDLSGRFTLHAPAQARYRLCWKSDVYGAGCTNPFIDAGKTAQFLSAVRITVPRRQGFVAMMGHVTNVDGSLTRHFDPYLNINAFATVGLDDEQGKHLADVYVNNFGDYLMPYVPIKQNIKLAAKIESGSVVQEIWREAKIEVAPVHRLDLKVVNNRPQLSPLAARDISGKRVQNAAPGSEVKLNAVARDRDGDPVSYAWFVDENDGSLSQKTGANVVWKLPAKPGRYNVTVVAYDNKGGYDKATLAVLADGNGVPFTGVVVDPTGAPVANAEIEVVGNAPIATNAKGRFATRVKEADRYVFNVRKQGYALNSQVYDRGHTGGRWILRPAQVVTIDPTHPVRVVHDRGARECPGLDSAHASLGAAGNTTLIPQWQDGKGNVVDAPSSRLDSNRSRAQKLPSVVLPRQIKLPRCGPGVSVELPANAIVDRAGNPVTTPIKVAISTVDLYSPQQMPGDESVIPTGGGGGYIESFGAGAFDLPPGMQLKPGVSAKISIAVDRTRLIGGAVLPPTVPYLSYDEKKGLWIEEGVLKLVTVGGVKRYEGKASHFSAFNADNVKNATASCVRVFSPTLPSQYDLEVSAPLGGGGAPKVLKKPIDQAATGTEHVIYNLPNNTNITLAPMTQGANPQLLGYYIVNTGGPQNPNNAPNVPPGPPYDSCQNFVVLKVGSAPDSPFGGEFLHGLGYLEATNLGFDDLTSAGPTGNALRDALVTASKNYYTSVDPLNLRDTLDKFKTQNGFGADPNLPAAGETVASYANSGDLGFGRDMHCRLPSAGNVACYVTNYGTGYNNTFPGVGTSDQDDADAAGSRSTVGASADVATVTMEYSPIENDPAGDRVVKFFVYKKGIAGYGRSISANLDGRGERPVPQLCMVCHGGIAPVQSGGVPAFGTAAQVKLGSRFLPFDHRLFTFPTASPRAAQEGAIKTLNQTIVDVVPAGAPTTDPIREVVKALYDNGVPAATQYLDSPVQGWKAGQSANAPGQTNFYNKVVANACRTCHIALPFEQLNFNTSQKFLHLSTTVSGVPVNNGLMLGTAELRACGDYTMPHALRTHEIFWGTYPPGTLAAIAGLSMPVEFNTFGNGVGGSTWKSNLCTSFISNTVSTPSNFYKQTIQPIWNGKCVACHVATGVASFFSLTESDSFTNLRGSSNFYVVPGNDSTGNLITRITSSGSNRMPKNCSQPPLPPGGLPCLTQGDIDKIKAWIRSGAN